MSDVVTTTSTTATKTSPFAGLLSAFHMLLAEIPIDPSTKANIKQTLADAGAVAEDAPAVAGAVASTAVQEVTNLAPAPVSEVLTMTGITPELEAFANALVTGIGDKFEATLEAHNKNTIAAIQAAVGS